MDKDPLFHEIRQDTGAGTFVQFRINGVMTTEERDLIQEALSLYKTRLEAEPSFSKPMNALKASLLETLDNLISRFDTTLKQ